MVKSIEETKLSPESDKTRKRKRNAIDMDTKMSIVRFLDKGNTIDATSKYFSLPRSTISTIKLKHMKPPAPPPSPALEPKKSPPMPSDSQLNAQYAKFIDDTLKENCHTSLKSLIKKLNDNFGMSVPVANIKTCIGSKFYFSIHRVQKVTEVTNNEDILWSRKQFVSLWQERVKQNRMLIFVEERSFRIDARSFNEKCIGRENSEEFVEPTIRKVFSVLAAITKTEVIHFEIHPKPRDSTIIFQNFLNAVLNMISENEAVNGITLVIPAGERQVDNAIDVIKSTRIVDFIQIPEESRFLNPVDRFFSCWIAQIKRMKPDCIEEVEFAMRLAVNENVQPCNLVKYYNDACAYFDKCCSLKQINF